MSTRSDRDPGYVPAKVTRVSAEDHALMESLAERAEKAEATIQAVREACDEALHEDPMPFGDFRRGYNMAMKVVLSLLDAP